MDSSLIQLGHFRLRCYRRRLTKQTLVLVKKRLRRQREALIVATNATLFLHTSLFPPSDLELLDLQCPGILISPNRVCAKINLPKFFRNTTLLALAKFFPGENFPLYGTMHIGVQILQSYNRGVLPCWGSCAPGYVHVYIVSWSS